MATEEAFAKLQAGLRQLGSSDATAFAITALEIGYANGLQAAEDLVLSVAAKYRESANRAEAKGGWDKAMERHREDSAVAERLAMLIRQQPRQPEQCDSPKEP